jgi:glyoxylase-like metal-dependent hydrolase (beta-lactamase superfamily II)
MVGFRARPAPAKQFQVDTAPHPITLCLKMTNQQTYFLEQIPVGPLMVNCYLFGCRQTNEAVIIDPGDEPENIMAKVAQRQARIKAVIFTHGHYDHLGALNEVRSAYQCPVMIHEAEADTITSPRANLSILTGEGLASEPADRLLTDGDLIDVGRLSLQVMHTPGHSPGGICLLYDKILFGGDLLFLTSIGRHDLPGGSYQQLEDSILNKVYKLPDETIVYPGHGDKTTVGFEKRHNMFVPER